MGTQCRHGIGRREEKEMIGRENKEWIGKTPDSCVPPHVRLRIFERHSGVCHLSKRRIKAGEPWDLDHVKALCNGGEHRESNLAPALRDKHREKTAQDVAERSYIDGLRSKHLGIRKPKKPMDGSRNSRWKKLMDGRTVAR